MTNISAGNCQFEISCAVFDKDGTLLDFEQAWGARIRTWVDLMVSRTRADEALARSFYRVFGYDPVQRQVAIDGPILAASARTTATLAAGALYTELGLPWHEAQVVAAETIKEIFARPLSEDEIRPLGDVQGAIRRLRDAGVMIAVATSDNRAITEQILDVLQIRQDVALLICGDDPLPQKPDPAVLEWIGQELDIDPTSMLMVGDTINDLLTGRSANAAGCVGISPPNSVGTSVLVRYADVILNSIDQLQVVEN